jgi:Flp pilus assembly protein TadD
MLQNETHEQQQVRRARRFRRRGEHRQAMLALREACQRSNQCPRLWTLYAVACVRVRRVDDAKHALRQALWLRQRARDEGRAQVTLRLIEQLEERDVQLPLRAA